MSAKLSCTGLLAGGLLLASASHANASGYAITFLETLGGPNSFAHAINNVGQVVGTASISDAAADFHAILWDGAAVTDLGALGGTYSWAFGINDAGKVVGDVSASGTQRATLWDRAAVTDLGTLGGRYSSAFGINNAGKVVGESSFTVGEEYDTHAFLWDNGTMTNLGTLSGWAYSSADAINSAGQVVGHSYNPNITTFRDSHATLWDGATVTDLGTLGGTNSYASAINNSGQVVGSAGTTSESGHAFLWEKGTMTDLGTLRGANNSEANAINHAGQVAGSSWNTSADTHATVWDGTTATDLNSFLDASTVNAGWVLQRATDINDNGWIVGDARNSRSGVIQAFLLTPDPGASPANPILPSENLQSGWTFIFPILDSPIWIDPLVATGYDYFLDSGPNFTSVLLPNNRIGDNLFDLYLWNGTHWTFNSILSAGTEHYFGGLGVDRFRIAGIETSAGLDPSSPTAFVTGLTFANTGQASMHMIPLVQVVPEPETYAMLLAGLGLLGFRSHRRKTV